MLLLLYCCFRMLTTLATFILSLFISPSLFYLCLCPLHLTLSLISLCALFISPFSPLSLSVRSSCHPSLFYLCLCPLNLSPRSFSSGPQPSAQRYCGLQQRQFIQLLRPKTLCVVRTVIVNYNVILPRSANSIHYRIVTLNKLIDYFSVGKRLAAHLKCDNLYRYFTTATLLV